MCQNILKLGISRAATSLVTAILLMSLGAPRLRAQGQSYLTGYVQDSSGASIPGATVEVRNVATTGTLILTTNSDGLYRTPNIDPGTYDVTVTKTGFQTLVTTGVLVEVGQPRGLNFSVQVGTVNQQIKVTAQAPLLRTEDSALGQSVSSGQVAELPFYNRSAGILIQLSPGVRYLGEDFISYGSSRFNGNGIGNPNVVLDGISISGDRLDVDQMIFNPSVDALSEVRVVQNQYSAEFGRDVGMLVEMQTKQGSSRLHGSLYEYLRNEALDTYNGFTDQKPIDREFISGGAIGGPIRKDKLFFFANVENQKQTIPYSALLTVPTAAEKQGDFSALSVPIFDPSTGVVNPATGIVTRSQFSYNGVANVIDPTRIDPVAKNVIHYMPDPNLAGLTQNLSSAGSAGNRLWKATGRIDWNISQKDQLFGVYDFHNDTYLDHGFAAYDVIDPGANTPFSTGEAGGFVVKSSIWNFHETHIFSPNTFLSVGFSYKPRWDSRQFPGINPAKHYAETIGIKNYPGALLPPSYGGDLGFPSFNFSGYQSVGPGYLEFAEHPMTVFDFTPVLTYVHGHHSFKMGFGLERGEHGAPDQSNPTGVFNFGRIETSAGSSDVGGDGIASLLLGLVNSGSGELGPEQIWRNYYYNLFFQDDFKVTPKLTLNLGFRWDIDAPVYEQNNEGNGFNFYALNPVSGTPGVVSFFGDPLHPQNSFYNTDWHRYAPRLGFAWQVLPNTVVRGGFGLYNISPILGANQRAPNLGFTTAPSFSSPDGGLTPAFLLQNGFPTYPLGGNRATLTQGFGAVPVGQDPTTSPTFVNPDWKFGYSENFNLSVERQLPGNLLLEIAGQSVLGRNLPLALNWNEVDPQFWGMPGNNQVRRPFPQYGNVTQIKDADGTSDYYAGYIRIEKRASHGLSLIGSFDWNKSLGFLGGSIYYPQLSRGPVLYGLDNMPTSQSPYVGLISWVYQLPVGPGKGYLTTGPLSKVFGGWDISGILTLRSGEFLDATSGTDSLNGNSPLGGRVNLVGDPNAVSGGRNAAHWFNRAAFQVPTFGSVGGECCGVLRGPTDEILNLSIGKDTVVHEQFKVRFSAEFFNFTNTLPLGNPDTNLADPSFGQIFGPLSEGADTIGGNGQRVVQLGLRIEF